MIVYLTKKQINLTQTEKETIIMVCVSYSLGAKKVQTTKEPEYWRIFKTEQEALNYLKN